MRLPPSGKPGFTLLPPDSTGVLFTNFLAEDRHLTNQIYLNGSGVAAGDVDGDDLVDLCFAGLDGPNKLFRNLGDWKFEDITEKAGVACPNLDATGVVLADLDGDGDLDLVVNSIGGGTHILFNDGKARFTESAKNPGLNARRGGSSLALADFDGDGALDLYIGNYRTVTIRDQPNTKFSFGFVNGKPTVMTINGRPLTEPDLTNRFNFKFRLGERGGTMTHEENGEPDLFLRNDGHGAFTPVPWTDGTFLDEAGQPLTEAPLDWTLSVMFRDLNGDGLPDLYTCSDFRSPDRIWLNDGRGHFRALPALALRHTTLSSMGIDVADLNRDGHDDIFVYDMLSRDHRLRFMQRIDIRPEPLPIGVIDNRPQYSRNMLFLARGDGTYAELAYLAGLEATDWAWTPLFLDVDLDGYEDLLVANGFERDNMNMDSLGRLEAAKAERKLEPLEALRLRKMFPRLDTPNQAYRNLGNLRFAEVGQEWNFAQRGVSQGMIAADLDNDGDLDVVVNNLNGAAFVLRNEAVAPRVAARLRGKAPNTHGIGAKIKVLGGPVPQSQEIMVGGRYQSSDAPMRAFAVEVQGSRSKVQSPPNAGLVIEVTWRSGAKSVVSNAQPNRIYEIDEAAAVTASNLKSEISNLKFFQDVSALLNHTHTEEPFDDFDRQPLLPHKLSQLGPGVSWFDLDGDGWDDLVIAGGKGGQLAAYRNDAKGGFTRLEGEPFAQPVYRDQTTVLGWRKPDGKVTLLAGSANYEDGQAEGSVVRFYDLDRKLVEDLLPGSPSSTGPLAMVDIDGDGQLDLFIGGRAMPGRYAEPASSLVFRGQGGSFVPDEANTKRFAASGLVSSAVFSDLDSDGDPDLVLACEWGLLKIFRNDRGSFTPWDWGLAWSTDSASLNSQPSTLSQLTGWWNGVAASDFDGDGRLDLIASNWGRNTKYEHWRAQLLRLYFGDLDANGTIDVVEAYFSDAMKKVVPSQQFHIVGAAMPIIREKLGTWQAYANASVEEIYGEALKQAGELRAVCLESTVFLNRGDKFEVRELPLEAQFAPAFAVCVGDLDGDGHEDAFLSQNFFAVHIDTSRHDAGRGLWLRGNGRGGFAPVPEQESGVLVYGEQRGAALCDFDADGRVDLAVTQNATQTKLFKNVGAKPGLRVRLLGPAGNPHGIGAVLRLDDGADKFGPARELHAGAGYWSQDSVVPVLSAPFTPKQLQVRWPGGRTTTSELPAGAREITVDPSGAVKERAR
ncbi:MAG: VCBS repeat-containing protein [Verrucomicrobia bacterium]|nr:VCBS repeat-containing protein [Verrucomicrobiota bacterium]